MSIGIDFGTLLNKIGCFNHTGFKIISNEYRNSSTPSVAFLNHKNNWIFGERGFKFGQVKPNQCVVELKTMLGHKFDDKQVQSNSNYWKFNIEKDKKGNCQIEISFDGESNYFPPHEIVGIILKNLIDSSKNKLPKPIRQTIISIPAYFSKSQKIDLIKAAELAELHNVHFIIEPILASFAYLYNSSLNPSENRNILVYSFGFSNPEATVIQIHDGTYEITTKRDEEITCRQFDINLFNYVDNKMKMNYPNKIQYLDQPKIKSKLHKACEEAKIQLSELQSADIIIKDEKKNPLVLTLTLEKFNEINYELFNKSMNCVKEVIKESEINQDSIDLLFLVGGSTHLANIKEKLKEITGKEPSTFADRCEAPTLGACILGAYLLLKESPEIMFQRDSNFFDNLKIFENVFVDENLNDQIECDNEIEKARENEECKDKKELPNKDEEAQEKNGQISYNENIEDLNSSLILIREELERLNKKCDGIFSDESKSQNESSEDVTAKKDEEQQKQAGMSNESIKDKENVNANEPVNLEEEEEEQKQADMSNESIKDKENVNANEPVTLEEEEEEQNQVDMSNENIKDKENVNANEPVTLEEEEQKQADMSNENIKDKENVVINEPVTLEEEEEEQNQADILGENVKDKEKSNVSPAALEEEEEINETTEESISVEKEETSEVTDESISIDEEEEKKDKNEPPERACDNKDSSETKETEVQYVEPLHIGKANDNAITRITASLQRDLQNSDNEKASFLSYFNIDDYFDHAIIGISFIVLLFYVFIKF